jgi:hypothetical protein
MLGHLWQLSLLSTCEVSTKNSRQVEDTGDVPPSKQQAGVTGEACLQTNRQAEDTNPHPLLSYTPFNFSLKTEEPLSH